MQDKYSQLSAREDREARLGAHKRGIPIKLQSLIRYLIIWLKELSITMKNVDRASLHKLKFVLQVKDLIE